MQTEPAVSVVEVDEADIPETEKYNGMTKAVWDQIVTTSSMQLDTSRKYKYARMMQIQENENLYLGIAEKEYKNPYDYCFPYMAGFVDYLMSEIDEMPIVTYTNQDEADYKLAQKTSAFFDQQAHSKLPHASWDIKDRWSKKLAIFSGVGILKFFAEGEDGKFRANLSNVDHYDFHNEPAGGGDNESHLFCGEEGIFKTKEQVEAGATAGIYNKYEALQLTTRTSQQTFKENTEAYNQRLNRHRGMGLDPESNNYVGQSLFKFVEWYLTYDGCRYYVLFEERSNIAIRIEKLKDMFSIVEPMDDALYPYSCWHTHEDPRVFWSKSPCDDVRPVAKSINKLLNQQLYNRDKQNMGHRLYDPKRIKDVKSLGEWRVDGLTPVDTSDGRIPISSLVYTLQTGNLSGTTEMVEFLDSWAGRKTGTTPGSEGQAPSSQKVGIFYGELEQISKRLSLYNQSYRDCWAGIGLRFRVGMKDKLTGEMPVKLMGAYGVEWSSISGSEAEPVHDYDITIEGGNETKAKRDRENTLKQTALAAVTTVNPKWKDQQILKTAFTDEEIKDAFSIVDPGLKELLSEAALAEQEMVAGKNPPLNRGANAAFMQHLINFAENLSIPDDQERENKIAIKINQYAAAHAVIAVENEARSAMRLINDERARADLLVIQKGGTPGASDKPVDQNNTEEVVEKPLTDTNPTPM